MSFQCFLRVCSSRLRCCCSCLSCPFRSRGSKSSLFNRKSSEAANKQGIPANKVKAFIKQLAAYPNIRVIGLMCIAKLTFDEDVLRKSFRKMRDLKEEIEEMELPYAPCHELSMGMSNDYKIALEYGATTLRLGRIFLEGAK